jgi:hypothetical protein
MRGPQRGQRQGQKQPRCDPKARSAQPPLTADLASRPQKIDFENQFHLLANYRGGPSPVKLEAMRKKPGPAAKSGNSAQALRHAPTFRDTIAELA